MKYVLYINIKNDLNEYVNCSKLIEKIKSIKNELTIDEFKKIFTENKIIIKKCENNTMPLAKLEEPLVGYDITSSVKEIELGEVFENQQKYLNNINIHIRVQFDRELRIINLHYLALLIHKHNDLVKNKRLSIFLVPPSGSIYPYKNEFEKTNTSLFEKASKYLRPIISQENLGIIFGVYKEKTDRNDTIVRALNFKATGREYECFPLMVFDGNIKTKTNILNEYTNANKLASEGRVNHFESDQISCYDLLFEEGLAAKYFNKAKKMRSNWRFGFADSENPCIASCDYIFEVSYYTLKSKFKDQKLEISQYSDFISKEIDNTNLFCFAVFSILFDISSINLENDKLIFNKISQCFKHVKEICDGLYQIIQNSVLYSKSKMCFVSMSIQTNQEYNSIPAKKELKIIVSDLSENTILDTFQQNLYNEKNYIKSEDYMIFLSSTEISKKHREIYDRIDEAKNKNFFNQLSCFFNDFSNVRLDLKDFWFEFRQTDTSAHIGLSLFANSIKKSRGSFSVYSNKNYDVYLEQETYCYGEAKEVQRLFSFPGTEFNISLPIEINYELEEYNITQLHSMNYTENYESYAKFLDFVCTSITEPIDKEKYNTLYRKNIETKNTLTKFQLQMIWSNFWLSIFNKIDLNVEKSVSCIDYSEISFNERFLKSNNARETIVKGLIDALGIFASIHKDKEVYLALINVNDSIIQMFEQITPTLSLKSFPSNLQFFISDRTEKNQIHLAGKNYGFAIQNAYIIAIENGVQNYSGTIYYNIEKLLHPFSDRIKKPDPNNPIKLLPFTGLLDSKNNNQKMFFKKIQEIAEGEITSGEGYKIYNSHTRLGNKVHIDSFYEMSHLFYRTIMANNVAFYILRNLKEKVNLISDDIVFYGYASYSQAILMSLTKILENYRLNSDKFYQGQVSYAIYQYNLQHESNPNDIRIYLSNNTLKQASKTIKVIQIVPISSTLSTFSKMWVKFNDEHNSDDMYSLEENYTVFWVRDANSKIETTCISNDNGQKINLSKIESKYYCEPKASTVKTKFSSLRDKNIVNYILQGYATWQLPECCDKCFPKDNLLNETPLIETDQTSTVPSQQIHLKNESKKNQIKPLSEKDKIALSSLLGHIHYGHFIRGKNHYQFYVDTQGYFASVANDVKTWLKELRDNDVFFNSYSPCLNIIFSPSHNTNVGFSQYVNAYYFNGTAEIISINEDKTFRTNFICEHITLKRTIEKLYKDFIESNFGYNAVIDFKNFKPMRFIFVDDNLITGETFRKASNFLQSLLPEELVENYSTNVFDMCFVLIDRLSDSSKNSYILPKQNYHAFCHLDISNTRRQGDSCVGCKLKKGAARLYKRSATQYSSNYWANKLKKFKEKSFETVITNASDSDKNIAYLRAILSHIVKNCFDNSYDDFEYFKIIIALFNHSLGYSDYDKYFCKTQLDFLKSCNDIIKLTCEAVTKNLPQNQLEAYRSINKIDRISCLIKIITRPFFTFNHCFKNQILKFVIILCECIISESLETNTEYAEGYTVARKITNNLSSDKERLDFLKNTVLEALADLHSTYLLRKSTMIKIINFINKIDEDSNLCEGRNNENTKCIIYNKAEDKNKCVFSKIECFFLFYSICVQRIVDESSDETRSLWLENFLVTGNDSYLPIEKAQKYLSTPFYKSIVSNIINIKPNVEEAFKLFCNEIFLSNGRIHFDGIEHAHIIDLGDKNSKTLDNYFLDYWKDVRIKDNCWLSNTEEIKQNNSLTDYGVNKELGFYKLLFDDNDNPSNQGRELISKRYKLFLSRIKEMISAKYDVCGKNIRLALLTCSNNPETPDIRDLELVESTFLDEYAHNDLSSDSNKRESNAKYTIKKRVIKALSKSNDNSLKKFGYTIEYADSLDADYNETQKQIDLNEQFEIAEKTNYRKPYFILCFDNPYRQSEKESGHETQELVPVYLYVSLVIDEERKRQKLPYIILRDILSFRNGIVKYLEADFTNDIMRRYSYSIDTEAILKNEKVMSHTPMEQDKNEIDLLISNKNNQNVNINTYIDADIITKIKDWAIARNYCNTMVARLYNRVFRNINKTLKEVIDESLKSENREAYKLYVRANLNDGKSIPLTQIKQILPTTQESNDDDTIYNLFKELIRFKIDSNLISHKAFICEQTLDSSYAYNLEYIKSIIYRICFDALRFCFSSGAEYNNFVLRIANNYQNLNRTKKLWNKSEKLLKLLNDQLENDVCNITFCFEECKDSSSFDWLVIKNVLFKTESDNIGFLKKKMEDPLDFTDGHMSLITAKEYLAKLLPKEDEKLLTQMYTYAMENGTKIFVTKLPIIRKDDCDR